MFLKSISIENVRCLKELKIDFTELESGSARKWTAILGNNGCGKSTLLKSICLVLSGSDALAKLIDQPKSWIRKGAKKASIQAEISTAENEMRKVKLDILSTDTISSLLKRNEENLNTIDSAVKYNQASYFVAAYGTSRRLNYEEVRRSKRGNLRSGSVLTLFNADANLNPLQSWAVDLHYKNGNKGLKIVKDAMNGLLPDVQFVSIDKNELDLTFKTLDGKVNLKYLSDGYQNVAAWSGDLLYRITEAFGHHNNPLNARGLLIIDEVDLHLHPAWQRQLREFINLRLPNIQVIFTTHSVQTIHQMGEGEVFSLVRGDESGLPKLNALEIAPNRLQLHQLLGPAFGINTFDSLEIERKKTEYKNLKTIKAKNSSQKKRFAELKEFLLDLPDKNFATDGQKKQGNLLKHLQQILLAENKANNKTMTKRAVARAEVEKKVAAEKPAAKKKTSAVKATKTRKAKKALKK